MNYMIHACPQREWYVDEFLVPSMLEQGIDVDDIIIWIDRHGVGNLESCMQSFKYVPEDGHTWHLQDDVCISRDFYEKTQKYNDFDGLVCGLCTFYDKKRKDFYNEESNDLSMLWFSFPCIKIPNRLARHCALHYYNSNEYDDWKEKKRGDDSVFKRYIRKHKPNTKFINLNPNIVNHIDYLINGSTSPKKNIGKKAESLYFEDKSIVKDLTKKIGERNSELEGRND